MPFTNVQLNPNELPQIEEIIYTPLNSSYRTSSIIGNLIFWFVISTIVGSFLTINKDMFNHLFDNNATTAKMILLGIFLLLVSFSFFVVIRGFSQKGFAIREKDISYKSGLFWKTVVNIPFNRVQHAEVKQGPIERFYNLSQLRIFTAGGSSSDLKIPGLLPGQAESLKRLIVNKVSIDEQE